MKDYISIDVQPNIDDKSLCERVTHALPQFKWRRGDSDMQGPYLAGVNDDNVHIELWYGEKPISMSVSFSSMPGDAAMREIIKEKYLENIKVNLIPSIGRIVKISI